MGWPLSQDYNEAIQSPAISFGDPDLRAGEAVCNAVGLPIPRTGNFADVYEFRSPQGRWALKFFTREVPNLHERYRLISEGLSAARLPFAVDFQFLERGIRIRGQWYPVLKMEWVDGFLLNEFVRDNLDKPQLLEGLLTIWLRMANRLREAGIAHADLQHGNVIFVPGSKTSSLAVKLIDYDGMFVPALAGSRSGEVGHPNFQHPARLRTGRFDAEVDRFSLLVVACALRALTVAGRALWDRFDNGDNLLFREVDFRNPAASPVFQALRAVPDQTTQMLVAHLAAAAETDMDQCPLLESLVELTRDPKDNPLDFAAPQADKEHRTRTSRLKNPGRTNRTWGIVGGVVALGLVAMAVALVAFRGSDAKPEPHDVGASTKDPSPVANKTPPPVKTPAKQPPPKVVAKVDPPPVAKGVMAELPESLSKIELAGRLGDDDVKVRRAAAFRLTKVVKPGDAAADGITLPLKKALSDDDLNVREGAAYALSNIGGAAGAAAVDVLLAALASDSVASKRRAATALGNVGPPAERATPELIACLTHSDGGLREDAVNALGALGKGAAEAVEPLVALVCDRRQPAGLRRSAATALSEMGETPAAVAAVPKLLDVMSDPSDEGVVRERIFWALRVHDSKLCDMPGALEAFRKVLTEPAAKNNRLVRQDCAYFTSTLFGSKAPLEVFPVLLEHLKVDRGTKSALDALKAIGAPQVRKRPEIVAEVARLADSDQITPDFRAQCSELLRALKRTDKVSIGEASASVVQKIKDGSPEWTYGLDITKEFHRKKMTATDVQPFVRRGPGGEVVSLIFHWKDVELSTATVPSLEEASRAAFEAPKLIAGLREAEFRLADDGTTTFAKLSVKGGDSFKAGQTVSTSNRLYGWHQFFSELKLPSVDAAATSGDPMPSELPKDPPPKELVKVVPPAKDPPKVVEPKPGFGEITNSIGMKLVLVPAGKFTMGSPTGEKSRQTDEAQRDVTLSKAFWLGKTEVTQDEYEKVMKKNPSRFKGQRLPVEQISWHDAKEFCRKLSELDKNEYSLPTEAEWEYACRAGTRGAFSTGDNVTARQANFKGDRAAAAGSLLQNPFGLHDMHGNVWEWCEDWYGAYDKNPSLDPKGPATGAGRVIRGGSWNDYAVSGRSACRGSREPTARSDVVGFRVVMRAGK